MRRLLDLVMLTFFLTACGEAEENYEKQKSGTLEHEGLLMETKIEHRDDETEISIQVTNKSDHPESFTISDGHAFDIRLLDEKGNVQYDFAEGKMFTQAVITEELESDETHEWTETLPADVYRNEKIAAAEVTVRIDEWRGNAVTDDDLRIEKPWDL
ncbi:BsuPI-related putative proteinase inhibitor [Salisediminibacterium halotolerans]|uniref:BsuPI-related putative proteinase inhibitor n=2 Tax=Salisediminibacterium halotolerans TaxID=517425 RepID=UPI000EB5BB28|nr:BsuPI-related putative proteinase inhibitor [Salisediminibacterium halotolerans]RLJ74467.1 intracellular proteinase inhibitor BsuPI [Actinophytocola xinjiangensis]RPE87440.1 intracellular proteinase inhibitor BsuPI [Salisediminibacterium halotolerans]TWG35303.1 intracellular proteinase inhibitor BsuPI [Salisediminibacterium halotolerans]GEL07935.1 hypothetical protein SHA02_13510 [Salisediminibacterium halotolerans]